MAIKTISDKEDRRFKSEVRKSHTTVELVAQHLAKEGWQVEVTPLKIREHFEDRADYGDDADLYIWKENAPKIGVEVKGRTLDFTSATDFKYATINVDRASKVDKSSVSLYISVNKARTHLAIISRDTKDQWTTLTKFDRFKGYNVTTYICPKNLVQFVAL